MLYQLMQNKHLTNRNSSSQKKNIQKTRSRMTFLNLIKNIYLKLTADIVENGENLDAFSLRLMIKPYVPFHHSYSIVCSPASSKRKKKGKKCIQVYELGKKP